VILPLFLGNEVQIACICSIILVVSVIIAAIVAFMQQ
jgi:hypothetical protein